MFVVWILIIIGVVALDQVSKILVVEYLDRDNPFVIIEGVFRLKYSENRGAAFGSFEESRWVFMIASVVGIIALSVYLFKFKPKSKLACASLSMIIGGGIGNMIDRCFREGEIYAGKKVVVDFFDFYAFPDVWNAIFNVADSFVCIGAGLLILWCVISMVQEIKAERLAKAAKTSGAELKIVCATDANRELISDIEYLSERLSEKGASVIPAAEQSEDKNEILIGDASREEIKELTALLGKDEFALKLYARGEHYTVALAYTSERARMCGLQCLISRLSEGKIALSEGETLRGKGSIDSLFEYMGADLTLDKRVIDNFIIYETGATMRDPNVIYRDSHYYMYGTGWKCYKATSLEGPWEKLEIIKHSDLDSYGIKTGEVSNPWAPEVHEYKGKYYMFTTYACGAHDCDYKVKEHMKGFWQVPHGHRANIVLRADSPEGPFVPISRNANGEPGHPTPDDLYTIDATLYVDREGQPWMVYSKEWMTVDAPKGSFFAAKLSDDLSAFISESKLVFPATLKPEDNSWEGDGCMDGEFFYRASDGTLYMLWSPKVNGGYSVAVAKSKSGELDGPWSAESELLFSQEMGDGADGGHGSLFADEFGQLWLAIHSPNGGGPARPTFVPLVEKDNKLVWGLKKRK